MKSSRDNITTLLAQALKDKRQASNDDALKTSLMEIEARLLLAKEEQVIANLFCRTILLKNLRQSTLN